MGRVRHVAVLRALPQCTENNRRTDRSVSDDSGLLAASRLWLAPLTVVLFPACDVDNAPATLGVNAAGESRIEARESHPLIAATWGSGELFGEAG